MIGGISRANIKARVILYQGSAAVQFSRLLPVIVGKTAKYLAGFFFPTYWYLIQIASNMRNKINTFERLFDFLHSKSFKSTTLFVANLLTLRSVDLFWVVRRSNGRELSHV